MRFWPFRKGKKDPDTELTGKEIISFEIQCGKCGEKVKVLVNKNTDLEDQYLNQGEEGAAFTLKKEAMDSKCFSLMTLTAAFDADKNLLSQEVEGGKFI